MSDEPRNLALVADIDAPSAGNPDLDAELPTIMSSAELNGLDMSNSEIEGSCKALNDLAPWEVRRYVETLANLLKHASPGQWRLGNCGGSVVNDEATAMPEDSARFYGGNLIFESARLADRELLVFLRNIAPSLLHDIMYCERVEKINDGLLKACGQLYAENKELSRRLAEYELSTKMI